MKGFLHNSPQTPTTMDNLPEDVIYNILIQLRAKQLAQMRCISKSWNALLSQSSLVKFHLDRSIHNSKGTLLVLSNLFPFDSESFTAVHPQSENSRGRVIGSVNGLICFEYRSQPGFAVINIWNHSLSALLTLPLFIPSDKSVWTSFRFGFDPKTDDYKVVKLTQAQTLKEISVNKWIQVEVYSMRKGNWKLITQTIPSRLTYLFDFDFVCVDGHNGHLHWLAETDFGWNVSTILSFDLGAETFREISLPDPIREDNVFGVTNVLGVLDRKLCVMSRAVPDGECEVWVMDEYGVAESWVKRLVLPPFTSYENSYGFTLHNEFLFRASPHGLTLYDPITAKTKSFRFHGRYDKAGKVVEYIDSLVWVTPAKLHEMSCCTESRLQY